MADIYAARPLSRFLGLVSMLFLWWAAASLLTLRITNALYGLVGSVAVGWVAYRVAGGRDNPGLARASWQEKTEIRVVSDPVASWSAKIRATFDMLEQESHGDYRVALQQLELRSIPAPVQTAYEAAVANPSRATWEALRDAFLGNPPR